MSSEKYEVNGDFKEKKAFLEKEKEKEAQVDFVKEQAGPVDRWNVVYFIFVLHGIGTLMPWNMFITARSYFVYYKLANLANVTEAAEAAEAATDVVTYAYDNATSIIDGIIANATETPLTMYQSYFLQSLGFVAQVPNFILNGINLFCQCGGGGNITKRITWSIIICVVMFIITVALAMVDSSEWKVEFFWFTMITVVIINMANGVYQNSVYGSAACLPMKYTNAVVLGSNISGTMTAVLAIITMASTPNPRSSAIYYFITAIFVLILAFDTYFILPLIPFYRYWKSRAEADRVKSGEGESEAPPFWYIFKQGYKQFLSVFFVFFVTLACFPAILASVKADEGFFIGKDWFTAVTCFLFFNLFAMIGNLAANLKKLPGPNLVWIPVVLRVLFIPFFMFCNARPESRMLPVLITNEYVYILGGILLAFTSGYYSSLTMMYAPGCVEPRYQPYAGMMAAFSLITGIFLGVLFASPLTLMIDNLGGGEL